MTVRTAIEVSLTTATNLFHIDVVPRLLHAVTNLHRGVTWSATACLLLT
jgi:hypothetical protein